MKLIIVALSMLAIAACDSGSSSSRPICKYQSDNYHYLKDTKGASHSETLQAKVDMLECMSRRLHSEIRSRQ